MQKKKVEDRRKINKHVNRENIKSPRVKRKAEEDEEPKPGGEGNGGPPDLSGGRIQNPASRTPCFSEGTERLMVPEMGPTSTLLDGGKIREISLQCNCRREEEVKWERRKEDEDPWKDGDVRRVAAAVVEKERRKRGEDI